MPLKGFSDLALLMRLMVLLKFWLAVLMFDWFERAVDEAMELELLGRESASESSLMPFYSAIFWPMSRRP